MTETTTIAAAAFGNLSRTIVKFNANHPASGLLESAAGSVGLLEFEGKRIPSSWGSLQAESNFR